VRTKFDIYVSILTDKTFFKSLDEPFQANQYFHEKTKAMIFCKCKERQQYESNIEIVESHSYLGLTFNICKKIKKLAEKAQKALYALYSKTRNLNIPIDL
jgi:hypothetical protein